MSVAMAAMLGGQALGGIIGASQARKVQEAALAQSAEFRNRALAELEKVGIPSIEAQRLTLENPELIFNYVPQLEQEFPEMATALKQIEVDPRLKEAQMSALEGLRERSEMGLTPAEQAQIDELRRGTAQQEQARQAGILQEMERRGLGGGGAELAARLSSSQAATQRAAEESDRLAAMQFEAKQAALGRLGQLGGQIRGQEFGEQAKVASAEDAIRQFNLMQQAGVQQRNIEAQRQAQLEKQRLAQQLEQQRAQTANVQQQYNKELQARKFQQEMAKAGAIAGALTGQAGSAERAGAQEAASKQQMWSGIGQLGGGVAALGLEEKKA